MKKKALFPLFFCLVFLITACVNNSRIGETTQTVTETQTAAPSEEITATETQTITPTPYPSGTAQNPVIMGIVYTNEETQSPAAQKFVQYLADNTNLVFQLQPYDTDIELLAAMDQGQVSLAWLQPVPYIYASDMGVASVALLSNHYGIFYYGSQFLVNVTDGFDLYYDPKFGRTTDNPAEALFQFSDKTPCMIDQKSLSGYVVPWGLAIDSNIPLEEPIFMKSHESVIRALYAGGICDFGVTYGISGDPRTASAIQRDLPDVMDKVVILWQSDPVIPTLNLSYGTALPREIQDSITTAVLNLMKLADGPEMISTMNNYSIEELSPVGEDAYDNLRYLIQSSGIDLESLLD